MELSATELRIGNIIKLSESNEIFMAYEICSYGFRVRNKNEDTWIEEWQFEGIQLTEEWLLRFGFEKAKHSHGYDCYIKDGFDFDIVSHGRYWVLAIYTDESCTNSLYFAHGRFEYVHQLQNLYFALTGEELTI